MPSLFRNSQRPKRLDSILVIQYGQFPFSIDCFFVFFSLFNSTKSYPNKEDHPSSYFIRLGPFSFPLFFVVKSKPLILLQSWENHCILLQFFSPHMNIPLRLVARDWPPVNNCQQRTNKDQQILHKPSDIRWSSPFNNLRLNIYKESLKKKKKLK